MRDYLFSDFLSLAEFLRFRNGQAALSMKELKPLVGFKRFKVNVVRQLEELLDHEGIQFFGDSLPKDQDELVILYLKNHPVADILGRSKRVCFGQEIDKYKTLTQLLKRILSEIEEV